LRATAKNSRSESTPITACATQSVTTSASVTLRRAFFGPFRQEIVRGAEHRNEQQVEVGEHRGPLGSTARLSTADFDLC